MLDPIFIERTRNFYNASIDRITSSQSLVIEGFSDVQDDLSDVKAKLEMARPYFEALLSCEQLPELYLEGIPRFYSQTGELMKDLWQAYDYLDFVAQFLSWSKEKISEEHSVFDTLGFLDYVVNQSQDAVVRALSKFDSN